ncbi:MAG: SusC/RagA family TonB-linked outer membrane protein [Janthinobacterium lividum]
MIKFQLKLKGRHGLYISMLLAYFVFNTVAYAQNSTAIKGIVVDGKGIALPGVTIGVKGSAILTATDLKGKYTIQAGKTDVLVFKYVGFNTREVPVNNQTSVSVTLTETSTSLNEVVVIGYGTKKKSDLTGTVVSINNEDIVKSKAPNAQEALQGRLSGVDVKRSSGRPGSDMTIEIRGANSITGNTQPLYVVDGIPTGNINDINPSDIERIDVLKDASSTAIFGSRGANGVVIVTTKRGSKGGTKITYDAYFGIVNAYNLPKMMDGPTFVNYAREFYKTLGANATPATTYTDNQIFSATELANISSGNYTNWVNLIRRNGLQSNHNLSITGGDEKTTYFLSAGYQDYQGAVKVEDTKKYTLKVGLDKNISNTFKVGASIYSAYSDVNLGSSEIFRSAYRLRPTGSAYNSDGSDKFYAYETESQITNPLFDLTNEVRKTQYIRLFPNIYGEANFLKGFRFRTSFTPDITFQRNGLYDDTYTKANAGTKPSSGQNGATHYFNYTLDNILTYNKNIGDKHKLDFTLGNSLNYYQTDYNLITVVGLPYRSLWYNVGSTTAVTINGTTTQPSTTVASGYTQQNIASFFFRTNYTLNNRYLFTLTGRTDGNSIFADGHKWGFFPSAAAAWILSEEDFIKNIKAINFLKLRFTYGQSGNAALSSYLYPYVTQSTVGTTYYDFNGSVANGFAPSILANQNLSWERTTEYNGGLEVNVLKSRIGLTLDYYNKTSKGSILSQQIPAANGFTTVTTNLGSVRNSGVEVGLNTTDIKTSNFSWTTSINYAHNKNKILELYGDGKDDVGNARFIGQKSRVIYDYKVIGVWQTSEATQAATYGQKPGQYKIQDTNGDGKITTADRVVLGSDIPNWFGGITNSFNYKKFDFSFTVYTRQGTLQRSTFLNLYLNGDQNRARFNAYDRSYWTTTNPSNTWANNAIETDATRRSAAEYQNSSYVKISNATLGYTFPKSMISKIKLTNLHLYVTATNPLIFTKFIGWDPETADLSSYGLQDFRTRTFILGVNVSL